MASWQTASTTRVMPWAVILAARATTEVTVARTTNHCISGGTSVRGVPPEITDMAFSASDTANSERTSPRLRRDDTFGCSALEVPRLRKKEESVVSRKGILRKA